MHTKTLLTTFAMVVVTGSFVFGQTVGSRAGPALGANGRSAGLQQTGQLSSSAAFSRNPSRPVGGNSGSFLSQGQVTRQSPGGLAGSEGLASVASGYLTSGLGRGLGSSFGLRNPLERVEQTLAGPTVPTPRPGLASVPYRASPQLQSEVGDTLVARRFSERLTKIPGLEGAEHVKVAVEGRTAVLTGAVGSEHQRQLIERLARLEPGISAIRNELDVESSPAGGPSD